MRSFLFTFLLVLFSLGLSVGQSSASIVKTSFGVSQGACSNTITQIGQSFVEQSSGQLPNVEYCGEGAGGGG